MLALTLSEAHALLGGLVLIIDAVPRQPRNSTQDHEALRGRGRGPNDPTVCPEGCNVGQGVRVLCTRDDGHDGCHMHANDAGLIQAEWYWVERPEE